MPYLVDNLWEWKRPDKFPGRRHSVFANPLKRLARKSGSKDGHLYRVEIGEDAQITQVRVCDSKYHPECMSLAQLIRDLLGQSWTDADLSAKQDAGRLFIPCLAKHEIDDLFSAGRLKKMKTKVWRAIKYWDEARLLGAKERWPYRDGEVFVRAKEYRLIVLDS